MILLQGHAVTLTFKVATQMLRVTRHINSVKNGYHSYDIVVKSDFK
jgi:hypothetical protein